MKIWSDNERTVVRDALREGSVFRTAFEKFCAARAESNRKDAQSAMLSVPRNWEQAADYMARAAEDESLIARFESEVNDL